MPQLFQAGVIFAVGFNALLGLFVFAKSVQQARQNGPLRFRQLARAAFRALAAASLCLCGEMILLFPFGRFFGTIHLIYLFLAVVPPAVGVASLWFARGGARPAIAVLGPALLLMLPALICAYASLIEPFRLQLERQDVFLAHWPAGQSLRIGVLADLQTNHVTEYEQRAIARLLAEKPDLILLTGDYFQGNDGLFERELPALRELLSRLQAPLGVWAVLGDVDPPARTRQLLKDCGIHLLCNETTVIDAHGVQLALGGVELRYDSPTARQTIQTLRSAVANVRLLIAHRPDVIFEVSPSDNIDLVVAGHTHGGQVVLPGFGPLMTLSGVPRSVAAGGLHQVDAQAIYVSRGVGCERGCAPRLRLFCPPEISLLKLGPKNSAP